MRQTKEAGHVIVGEPDLEIGGTWFYPETGDSFRFAGEPYRQSKSGRNELISTGFAKQNQSLD